MTTQEKSIHIYLEKQGLNCSISGYNYLITAILYTLDNPWVSLQETYAYIATRHDASVSQVRRAIGYILKDTKITPKKFIRSATLAVKIEDNEAGKD